MSSSINLKKKGIKIKMIVACVAIIWYNRINKSSRFISVLVARCIIYYI